MQYLLMIVALIAAYWVGWMVRDENKCIIPQDKVVMFGLLAAFCALFALLMIANSFVAAETWSACKDIYLSP